MTARTRRRERSIETTTTTEGVTVPFIVRLETGYIDRDQYAIATLFDPGQALAADAAAAPVQPPARHHARLLLRHLL